jgi:hypothetical protein
VTLTYKGALSLAAARSPLQALSPLILNAHGEAAIALTASIDGAFSLNATLSITPPTLAATITALATFEANCSAALALGLPTVSFDVTAAANLVAHLQASLALLGTLQALLNAPCAVGALGYLGTGNLLGAAVSALTALITPTNALIVAGVDNPLTVPPAIAHVQLVKFLNGVSWPGANLFTTLGQITPVTVNSLVQGNASIQYQLGLALELAANIAVSPPTFSASIQAAIAFAAALQVDGVLALPSVHFALDASAKIAASLQAQFNLLYNLGVALNRQDATFFVYTWDSIGSAGLGTDLTLALTSVWGDLTTSTLLPCAVAVFGVADPASLTALHSLFGGAY